MVGIALLPIGIRTSHFRDVHRDLRTADSHAEAVKDTANDQHWDVLGRSDDDASEDPDNGRDPSRGISSFLQYVTV